MPFITSVLHREDILVYEVLTCESVLYMKVSLVERFGSWYSGQVSLTEEMSWIERILNRGVLLHIYGTVPYMGSLIERF